MTKKGQTGQAERDQEVLRANRELAAYFKGRRTEREARAALKIIKAFVRDRERQEAKARSPLPGFMARETKKPTGRVALKAVLNAHGPHLPSTDEPTH
jgi:hypothetical protein